MLFFFDLVDGKMFLFFTDLVLAIYFERVIKI